MGSCVVERSAIQAGHSLRLETFQSRLHEYDALAGRFLSGSPELAEDYSVMYASSDRTNYIAKSAQGPLGPHKVYVVKEHDDSMSLRIEMLTSMIPTHHRVYMRRNDGDFETYLMDFERMSTVVNSNWCFVTD